MAPRTPLEWGWTVAALASAGALLWLVVGRNPALRARVAWERLLRRLGIDTTLCRRCRYNNPQDCRHRERPFATICEDFRRR